MKKTLMWVAAVVGICLWGVGGFYLGTKLAEKEQKVTETENNEKQDQTAGSVLSEADKTKLKKIINIIPEKASMTNIANDLTNNEKLLLARELMRFFNQDFDGDSFTGAELKKVLSNIFGNDLNIELDDIKCPSQWCDELWYKYDKNSDLFTNNPEHGGHGFESFEAYNVVNEYKQIGQTFTLEVGKVYYPSVEAGVYDGYYSSYEDLVQLKNEKKIEDENLWGDFESVYKLEKDNLPIYTYTFEKVGDNFIFKGYELSK